MIEYAKEYLAHNISVWHESTVQRVTYQQNSCIVCARHIHIHHCGLFSTIDVNCWCSCSVIISVICTVVSFIGQLSFLNVALLPHKIVLGTEISPCVGGCVLKCVHVKSNMKEFIWHTYPHSTTCLLLVHPPIIAVHVAIRSLCHHQVGAVDIDSGWSTGFNNFIFDTRKYPNASSMVSGRVRMTDRRLHVFVCIHRFFFHDNVIFIRCCA